MAYTLDVALALGAGNTGLSLEMQLKDTAGSNVGSAVTSGFVEFGATGNYLFHYAAWPDSHRGAAVFQIASGGAVKAAVAINPEEAENTDTKTSTRLATAGYTTPLTAGQVESAVWDAARSGHVTAGTFGLQGQIIRDGTAQAGAGGTITLDAGASAVDNFYNGVLVQIVGGTGAGQSRFISSYVGATKVATVNGNWLTTPSSSSQFLLLAFGTIPIVTTVSGSVGSIASGGIAAASFAAGAIDAAAIATDAIGSAELAASAVTEIQTGLATSAALATVQADTDDIQTRLPAALVSGRIDASVGAMAANVLTATAIATDAITAAKIAADAIGASELATDAVTEIQAAVAAGPVASVTGNVGGNVVGSVGSVLAGVGLSTLESLVLQSGTAQAGGASTITLAAGASATNDLYKGEVVKVYSGTGAGQARAISGYVGATKVATVSRPWATNPDNTSLYALLSLSVPALDASLQVTAASVQGNVTGSVGSVAAGGIAAASFAAGAIDATAIATDAIGSAELAASAVTEIQTGLATSAALATVQADTDDIQARLPAALVSGRIDASVGAMAADTVTAAAIATDAIGSAELAASAVTEIQSGLATAAALSTVQADTDDIQSRLPAALVSGRIDASVGAVAAGAITAAAIATGAVDADALATDAVTEIAAGVLATTIPELAQGAPAAVPSLSAALSLLYMALRNELKTTSGSLTISNDAGVVICKSALTDDSTTFTRAELVSGP